MSLNDRSEITESMKQTGLSLPMEFKMYNSPIGRTESGVQISSVTFGKPLVLRGVFQRYTFVFYSFNTKGKNITIVKFFNGKHMEKSVVFNKEKKGITTIKTYLMRGTDVQFDIEPREGELYLSIKEFSFKHTTYKKVWEGNLMNRLEWGLTLREMNKNERLSEQKRLSERDEND